MAAKKKAVRKAAKRSAPRKSVRNALKFALPAIGSKVAGGTFMGICRGRDGQPDYALILIDGEFNGNWKGATAWAKKQGGELPSRLEGRMLFANNADEFQEAWYWLAPEYAPDGGCAWLQHFDDGGQLCSRKDYVFRARAVRRSPIQQFINSRGAK